MSLNSSNKSKYFENFIAYRNFKYKWPVKIACIYVFICFRVTPKILVFPGAFENYWNFKFWPSQCTNNIHISIEQDTEVENRSIFSTIVVYNTDTKIKKWINKQNKKKAHNMVKSIHSSLRSESKIDDNANRLSLWFSYEM